MSEHVTDLADTVRALRQQLARAMDEGHNEALRFQVGRITLEFTVVISRDASTEGGIRFGVVSLGARGSLGDEVTHRMELTLDPVVCHGDQQRPAVVSGRTATGAEPR